jgi:hypothetical protein
MKKQMFTGLKLCALALLVFLAWRPVFAQAQNSEITVTVSRDLVRFVTPGDVQEIRVEVFSPTGEKLFDSDFVTGQTQDWPLKDLQGQAVESGLYAYTVTIKDKDGALRTQRGNVIVGRVTMEREIELTSGGIKFPDNTVQTTAANGDAAATGGKDGADGKDGVTETKPESKSINKQAAAAAKVEGSGTAGKIARWTDAGTIGDSVISQANGAVTIASPTAIEGDTPDNSEDSAGLTLRITRPTATRAGLAFQDQQLRPIGSMQLSRALAGGTSLAIRHQRADGQMRQVMTVTPLGYFGINTMNPNSQLEVSADLGSINNAVITAIGDVDGSSESVGQIAVQTQSLTRPTARMVMRDAQRAPLGAFEMRREPASAGTTTAITSKRADGQMRQALTVTPLGFCGVNTPNPTSLLEARADAGSINKAIFTATGDIDELDATAGQIVVLPATPAKETAGIAMLDSQRAPLSAIQTRRDSTSRGAALAINTMRNDGQMRQALTVDQRGYLGIDKPTPREKVDVNGMGVTRMRVNSDWNAGMRLAIKDQDQWSVATVEVPLGGTASGVSRDFQIYHELTGRNALYIKQGSLSIATGGGVSTNGNVSPVSDNAYFLGSQSQRWSAVFAANGTIQTSDARLKQGVENLGYGLREVMRLRPVTFKWKETDDARTHLGLIAQEVEPIIPEAIEKGATPDAPLGMNYTSVVPVLIKAVQEQQAEIARRDAQINALRQQLADLAARLKAIEQTLPQATRQ